MKKLLLLVILLTSANSAFAQTLLLTAPATTGGTFEVGQNITVSWGASGNIGTTKYIQYAPWGTANYTTAQTINSGASSGTISIASPGDYRLRVITNLGIADSTDGPVHIVPDMADLLHIIRPSAGDVLTPPGTYDTLIFYQNFDVFSAGGVSFIDSTNTEIGVSGINLIDYTSNVKKYTMTIPPGECHGCRVVLSVIKTSGFIEVFDTSDVIETQARTIKGKVYFDYNNNGVYDAGDAPKAYPHVRAANPNVITGCQSDVAGNYILYLPSGSGLQTLVPDINELCGIAAFPAQDTVTLTGGNIALTGHNYRLLPSQAGYNLKVSVVASKTAIPHPAMRKIFIANNGGTTSPAAVLTYSFEDSAEDYAPNYSLSNTPAASTTVGTIVFNIPPIAPCGQYVVTLAMQPTCPTGTTLLEIAAVTANGGTHTDSAYIYVHGSYDPNDKTVDTDTIYTTNLPYSDELYYMIRFQNTGTEAAYNIRLSDTLSDYLDATTLRSLSGSHSYTLYMRPGNVAEWKFSNIMLPDSTTNEPGSHGYVIFGIRPKNTLAAGDVIENFADIYFDYNEPVRTNTAVTRVLLPTIPDGVNETTGVFSLYPNPAKGFVQVKLKENVSGKVTTRLFTVDGKVLQTTGHQLQNSSILIQDISKLANGLYFMGISINGKETVQKLLVAN